MNSRRCITLLWRQVSPYPKSARTGAHADPVAGFPHALYLSCGGASIRNAVQDGELIVGEFHVQRLHVLLKPGHPFRSGNRDDGNTQTFLLCVHPGQCDLRRVTPFVLATESTTWAIDGIACQDSVAGRDLRISLSTSEYGPRCPPGSRVRAAHTEPVRRPTGAWCPAGPTRASGTTTSTQSAPP